MAGAGKKTFTVGEVLTASDVNGYLMDQAVMRFADSGARGSAIGTATEGMVSYLADTDAVEVYDGSAWTALGAAGIGSNVASVTKTDTFSTSGTAYATVTGLSVSFTPTSATSKVLVLASVPVASVTASFGRVSIFRDGTNLVVPTSPGSRTPAVGSIHLPDPIGEMDRVIVPYSFALLDSPATTSAVTYDVRLAGNGATYVNRADDDTDNDNRFRTVATLTAIEVAA